MTDHHHRGRRAPRLASAALLTLALSAGALPAVAQSPAAGSPAAGGDAYPVTIAHTYGETVITQRPERVVTVGLTDQDPFLALGLAPVGVTEWFGEHPYGAWPWAAPLLGDATPEVLLAPDGIDFEAITALDPDLIVGLYSGLTQEEYDTLSQIAPTVAQPAEYSDWGIPWQQQTMLVGQILGKSAEAGQLVGSVEGLFAQVAAEHPEFSGKSAVVATPYEGIWVYGSEDTRGRLLTRLGFVLPEGLDEVTKSAYGGNLSEENVDMLDLDAIIWLDGANVEGLGGPLYDTLPVHTEGREVFLDSFGTPLGGATSFVTVLSLPFLLDGLAPLLALALDGDPATVVPRPSAAAPAASTAPAASPVASVAP
jgi:iron complex transport system substrate-binding protein